MVAIMLSANIVGRVKLKWQSFRLALVALLAALGAGCSGINASHSISPLMFLVPGLGKAEPANQNQIQNPTQKPDQIQASVPIVAQAQ
jgi:hypothetical protein